MAAGSCDELIICVITYPVDYAAARAWGRGRGWKMEAVQEEGDVSEVFLSLGPPEEALEHRPRVPRERRALGLGQREVEAREREPEIVAQLQGLVALGPQREGRDVERPRGHLALTAQGLESVNDLHPETIADGEDLPIMGQPSELRDLLQR